MNLAETNKETIGSDGGAFPEEKSDELVLEQGKKVAEKPLRNPDNPEVDEEDYPGGFRLVLITVCRYPKIILSHSTNCHHQIALCLSVFCMALDNTILATAIPRITDQFKSLDDIGWYGSSYLLTNSALQLIFGKIYTFYNIKWAYLIALFIFEIGSLLCGVAPNSTALIIGRAIAGVGGSGIFSGAMVIISKTVPLHQRPAYTGAVGSMYGIASVAGPLMGGAFTDRLTWRWCFYINLPFGAVTAFFILFWFKAPKRVQERALGWRAQIEQFDLLGTLFFIPSIVCLLIALQWGGSTYNWSNARIVVLFVLFVVFMACFIAIQIWKQENATVPPRIFKNRNVWGMGIFTSSMGASFFGIIYFVSPIYSLILV
jgi:MFS family permease